MKVYKREAHATIVIEACLLKAALALVKGKQFNSVEDGVKTMGGAVYQAFSTFSEGDIQEAINEAELEKNPLAVLQSSIFDSEEDEAAILSMAKDELEAEAEKAKAAAQEAEQLRRKATVEKAKELVKKSRSAGFPDAPSTPTAAGSTAPTTTGKKPN